MAASSLEPTSQRARAYQGFTQQILSGSIRPGQFISQRALMTLLDMPLGAVREIVGWSAGQIGHRYCHRHYRQFH